MRKVLPFIIAAIILFFAGCSPKRKESFYPKLNYDGKNATYVFIDKFGKELFNRSYEDILMSFEGDYAVVILDGRVAIVDRKGEAVLSGLDNVFEIKGDLATVKKGDICELVDLKTKDVLLKNDYIKIGENDIYTIFKDGLWGYVDLKNNLILEPQFDEAYKFGKKAAVAVKGSNVFIVGRDFKIDKSDFSDAIKINESLILAKKDDKTVLLNYDGEVLNSDVNGDITDANDELYSTFERIDGELLRKVLKIDGTPACDEAFVDVRLLNNGYFAAGKDGVFALYSVKNGRVTEHNYSFLDSEYFDVNGGKITAVSNNKGVVLNKNGEIIDDFDFYLSSLIYDGDVYIGSNEYGIIYFDKDKNVLARTPQVMNLGEIKLVTVNENGIYYPFVISNKTPKNLNENLKSIVDRISKNRKNHFLYELDGDILRVTIKNDFDYKFMVNINTGEEVKAEDIFIDAGIMNYIVEKVKSENDLTDDYKLLCFSYDGNLEVFLRGKRDYKETILKKDISKYLNLIAGNFFRSLNEPKINKR